MKRIDAHFSEYKFGIEIDEYNHESRNFIYEKSRQIMIESHGITIIRTNPDAIDFDMNNLINQIYKHISQSNKEKLENEEEVEIKTTKEQNKRTRKQNKRTKEQVWKRIIKWCV